MTPRSRLLIAAFVALLGLFGGLLFGPGVAQCLGPLGVTGVECARNSGWFPTVGAGLVILAACLGLAALVAIPGLARPRMLLAGIAGMLAAGAAYLALRPTTWTGPTSNGDVISLELPLDVTALALVAILGGLAGLTVMRLLAMARTSSVRSAAGR